MSGERRNSQEEIKLKNKREKVLIYNNNLGIL